MGATQAADVIKNIDSMFCGQGMQGSVSYLQLIMAISGNLFSFLMEIA